jgi:hypothetical protein
VLGNFGLDAAFEPFAEAHESLAVPHEACWPQPVS